MDAVKIIRDANWRLEVGDITREQYEELIAPLRDVETVIRCRDCEHKDRESGLCHGRGWPMQLVPDDGFCDKGKER